MINMNLYRAIKSGQVKVKRSSPDELRFWNNVNKNGPLTKYGRCWLWTASKTRKGYGQFSAEGRPIRAHRYSYKLFNGSLLAELLVMHKCDNPSCVNPKHLLAGTTLDNQRDKVNKNRQIKGESQTFSKLTNTQIRQIRKLYKRTAYNKSNAIELAKKFGISRTCLQFVINNQTWRHVS